MKNLPDTIRAVTFDIGSTLIEPWPSVGHVYAEVASRHGWGRLDPSALNRRFTAAWRAHVNFGHTRREWQTLVHLTFNGLGKRPPTQAFFNDLYARFREPDVWHVYPDVLPALQRLRQRGLKLGVISNWDRRLGPLLRTLGLWDHFDAVVVSCYMGTGKPDRVMFDTAVSRLRTRPEDILHIGDSLEMDWQGARNAGMQSVMLHRGSDPAPAGAIRGLREIA